MKSKESFYEGEEDASAAFMNTMEDIVQSIKVAQGAPFLGKTTGKPHPIYDVTLSGTSTERTRAFRFAVFRDYHQTKVEKSGFNVNAKFPKTYTKSSFGIKMSTKEVEQRCQDLDIYMREIYDRRNEWPPKLKDATLTLLKLDEANVFGDKRNRVPTVTETIRSAQDQVNREAADRELNKVVNANWSRQEAAASMLAKAKLVHKRYPTNRTARAVVGLEAWYKDLVDEDLKRLIACVKSGLDHPASELGCYAMHPSDYETLGSFFDRVCNDYHNNPSGDKIHVTNWKVSSSSSDNTLPEDGILDLRNLGLSAPLSMRVRVGRNLTSFPLPGAMTKDDRIKFELTMAKAFEQLMKDARFGGQVFSLTPHAEWKHVTGVDMNPNFMSEDKYKELVKAHVMFKDMSNDPYLKSAGISSDWPCGRGCYQSKDGGFIIWFGEEDQLRIMCMGKGYILNEVFDRLSKALEVVESIEGIVFAQSKKYGYVTSCPSNLGTGMRASVHLKLPNLCQDGTETKAVAIAKHLGLSVRGIGGEHTPIGSDGTVDISPSSRLYISEGEIINQLYQGIKLLLKAEQEASPPKNQAFLFIKPHANNNSVESIVKEHLELCGCEIIDSGKINTQQIDKMKLIDQHYYSIASKATMIKPKQLSLTNTMEASFENKYGISWSSVLLKELAYNAMDACDKLGITGDELNIKWSECKKQNLLLKLGGGFYCGLIDNLYIFNGFFMSMRSKYTQFTPSGGSFQDGITWLSIEWEASSMSWADFRSNLLGSTDPNDHTCEATSLRGMIRDAWKTLGLLTETNIGDNGVHGSASPFEAMCERLNWIHHAFYHENKEDEENKEDKENYKNKLYQFIEKDCFGSKLIQNGIPMTTIESWLLDPQVNMGNGQYKSLFDALEDLNASDCILICMKLYEVQSALEGSIIIRVNHGDYSGNQIQNQIINGKDGKRYAVLLKDHTTKNDMKTSFQPTKTSSKSSKKKSRRFLQTIRGCDRCKDLTIDVKKIAMKEAVEESIERKNIRNGHITVEELCEKRFIDGDESGTEYLVKWKGYADLEWLKPTQFSNSEELIEQYENNLLASKEQVLQAAQAAKKALENDAKTHPGSGGGGGGSSVGVGVSDEFKEAIENGINLVKFNRKGQAAFRTLAMLSWDDTMLTWRPTKKEGIGARLVRSTFKGENIDLRTLKDVRYGEAEDPDTQGKKWGTSTLRMYVQKNSHGVKMLGGGITFCLVFNGRSLDFGADSTAQRDFLVEGFKALQQKIQANNSIAEE